MVTRVGANQILVENVKKNDRDLLDRLLTDSMETSLLGGDILDKEL